MRRRLTTLMLTFATLWLTALPALATEGEGATSSVSSDSEINGILFAAIVGTIVGLILFIDAYRGDDASAHQHSEAEGH